MSRFPVAVVFLIAAALFRVPSAFATEDGRPPVPEGYELLVDVYTPVVICDNGVQREVLPFDLYLYGVPAVERDPTYLDWTNPNPGVTKGPCPTPPSGGGETPGNGGEQPGGNTGNPPHDGGNTPPSGGGETPGNGGEQPGGNTGNPPHDDTITPVVALPVTGSGDNSSNTAYLPFVMLALSGLAASGGAVLRVRRA